MNLLSALLVSFAVFFPTSGETSTLNRGGIYAVTVAAYSPEVRQTDKSPQITASGLKIRNEHFGKVIALSSDLAKGHKFGAKFKLYIGNQVYDVVYEDSTNKCWKKRIDLLLQTRSKCFQWGLKRGRLVSEK